MMNSKNDIIGIDREKPKSKLTARLIKYAIYILAAMIVFVFFAGFIKWSYEEEKFTVKSVQITGVEYSNPRELNKQSGLRKGRSIIGSFSDTEDRLERHPMVLSAEVTSDFPDAVLIEIQERRPLALLKIEDLLKPLDKEGSLLPLDIVRHQLDLPLIISHKNVTMEDNRIISPEILKSLRILDTIRVYDAGLLDLISEIGLNSENEVIITSLQNGAEILIGEKIDNDKSLALSIILRKLLKEQKGLELYDLRYRGQIIARMKT